MSDNKSITNLWEMDLSEKQKKKLWEFENWLLANKIGTPKGQTINIRKPFDPNTMMAYELNGRIFVLELDEIPNEFLR